MCKALLGASLPARHPKDVGNVRSIAFRLQEPVVRRGHVSLLPILDTWHSKNFLGHRATNHASPETVAMSSPLSAKSKRAALSPLCDLDVGITAAPCWSAHRSSTCAGLRPYFAAIASMWGSSFGEEGHQVGPKNAS
jgi:hypothetical protein